MATVSPMPAKADPARIRAPGASCPKVGANCRCVIDEYAMEGTRGVEERGGRKAERYGDGETRVTQLQISQWW
jgi:hypothetical protein